MPSKTATAKKTVKTTKSTKPAKASTSKSSAKPAAKTAKPVASKSVSKNVASKSKVKVAAKAVASAVKKPANSSVKPDKVTRIATKTPAAVKTSAKTVPAKSSVKPAKNDNQSYEYKAGDKVVYPAHGVGQVEGVEKLVIAGSEVTLYTITFEKDRMRLKLPLQKVQSSGLRRLANKEQLAEVYQTMKGRARIRRVMWSRRAQEYEAKINSGSPVQVAEVLRDLRRNVSSNEHSYSERQIFQQALERLATELAAIDNVSQDQAAEKLQTLLAESA